MYHATLTSTRINEPDWFRLGRDAVHVMSRLTGMKELDFYLRHPEPFIRLHAIRRISVLLLPEAITNLFRVLDDPLENEQNRDEAGWAIRRISLARSLPWFAHNEYTDRYSGSELPAERYGITVVENHGETTSPFPVALPEDLHLEDEVLLRIQMEEKRVSVDFSPMSWFTANCRHLLKALAIGFLGLARKLFLGTVHAISTGIRLLLVKSAELFRFLSRKHQESLAARREAKSAAAIHSSSGKTPSPQMVPVNATAILSTATAQRPGFKEMSGMKSNAEGTSAIRTYPQAMERPVVLIGLAEAGFATSAGTLSPAMFVSKPAMSIGTSALSASKPSMSIGTSALSASKPAMSIGTFAIHSSQFAGLAGSRHAIHPVRRRPKGGVPMFRLLFYPIRLVKQHWLFTITVIISIYVILGFTYVGRNLVHQINPRALFSNDRLVAATQTAFVGFFGMNSAAVTQPDAGLLVKKTGESAAIAAGDRTNLVQAGVPAAGTAYRVTASKGLNLRTEPVQTGSRIVWMPLDAKVGYQGETKSDPAGDEWMRVTFDGQTGWAMAKWMNPVEAAPKSGGSDGKP